MSLESCLGLFFILFKREARNSYKHHTKNISHPQRWFIGTDLKAISSKMRILVRTQVEKMKKTFDVETLAEDNFSENSPEENPMCAEQDEEKE